MRKEAAAVGETVTILRKKYVVMPGGRGCDGCAFETRPSCSTLPAPNCGNSKDGVIYMRPVDAVTYKLTGELPNE